MKKIARYLNPIEHLGDNSYSFIFPLLANVILCILSEVFAYEIAHNLTVVGDYIIFLNVAFIIYFAFREGILGGCISAVVSILYYFYIIYTHHYSPQQVSAGIDTTLMLGIIYFFLAAIIGWLKQTIDKLIEREANERLRLQMILQQLPVGVVITDAKGKVTQSNKQIEHIFNKKIPIGYDVSKDNQFLPELDSPSKSPLYQVIQKGKSLVEKEFILQRSNNRRTFIHISASAIRNKKKKIIAAASIVSDITQQKELEQQKDDFLSMASHELKTPLTSLKMFIDLQKRQLNQHDAEKAAYYNERIKDQANRLKELTDDLLDVSRIETNKLGFNVEPFDISKLIYETVESLQATTAKHAIVVKVVKKQLITADSYRIYQVLVNLLTNAIKYSPNGKIFIQMSKQKGNIVVSVKDGGIGISKEQQKRIFDRLYQVSDPKEKTYPGLGLGLYISKEIVERHHGKLWVESEKGKGAIFYFSLPLK